MKRYITYVEDDSEDIEIFKDFFCNASDIPVMFFPDGKALVQHLINAAEMPCLILLDMSNPVQSGDETINQLKATPKLSQLPLVLFSSSIQLPKAETYREQGFILLEKPASLEAWNTTCKQITDQCAASVQATG